MLATANHPTDDSRPIDATLYLALFDAKCVLVRHRQTFAKNHVSVKATAAM